MLLLALTFRGSRLTPAGIRSGSLLSVLSPSSTALLSPSLPSLPPPPRPPPLSLLSLATSTTGRLSGRISVGSRLP
eukprot:2527163-Heterocapsa_arctica.AAC.1